MTGANAVMPIQSGALAGLANLRDTVAHAISGPARFHRRRPRQRLRRNQHDDRRDNCRACSPIPARPRFPGRRSFPASPARSRCRAPSIRRRAARSISSATAGSMARPMCRTARAPRATTRLIQQDIAALSATTELSLGRRPHDFDQPDRITRRIRRAGSMANINRRAMSATYQSTLPAQASQALVQRDRRQYRQPDVANARSRKLLSGVGQIDLDDQLRCSAPSCRRWRDMSLNSVSSSTHVVDPAKQRHAAPVAADDASSRKARPASSPTSV